MGDLTGEYFARVSFIKAVKWLSKFDKNFGGLKVFEVEAIQKDKIKKLKQKFEKLHSIN